KMSKLIGSRLKQIAGIKKINMTKEINNYINEFETIYNGEPWYGKSLMAVLANANAKDIFKRQNGHGHTAYEVAYHLYAWRDLLAKRLKGDTKSSIEVNSKQDWPSLPEEQTTMTWNELIKKIEKNQKELVGSLSKWTDESLDKDFAGTNYSLRIFLNGQIQHDIYHI